MSRWPIVRRTLRLFIKNCRFACKEWTSKDPQRDVYEDPDQELTVAFTQDGEGNYATIDQSPGGQILSDQRFKMALKKVLNYDDDMVDRLLYGTKN